MKNVTEQHIDSYKLSGVLKSIASIVKKYPDYMTDPEAQAMVWINAAKNILAASEPRLDFDAHKALYDFIFKYRRVEDGPPILAAVLENLFRIQKYPCWVWSLQLENYIMVFFREQGGLTMR